MEFSAMSTEEDSFFINAVPPFDFDEINEYYCWDGSDEDEALLHDLDTMVCVEIKEINEPSPMEFNQDKSITDYRIHLTKKKYDPFHIALSPDLKKRHKCDICFKMYANTATLTRHKQRHKNFKCEICNDEFNAKTPLSRHMAMFHKKTVPCDFCTKKFYTIQQLAEHFETKHDKELIDEEQENINMEEANNSSQPKNLLDSELKLTLDSFLTKYKNKSENDFSEGFPETKNVTDSKYTQESTDYTSNSPNYLSINSPRHVPKSPINTQNSPKYTLNSPKYTPNSPKYTPFSPDYTAVSPKYAPAPKYALGTPNSLNYTPDSPIYTPSSPIYTPSSPKYFPTSPGYTPASAKYAYTSNSPNYTTNSPNYTPNSPKYTSNSPILSFKDDVLSDLPEIKLPKKNGKPKNSPKPQKTINDYFKTIEKH